MKAFLQTTVLATLLAAVLLSFTTMERGVEDRIDLSGKWQFGMGDKEHYDDHIQLPGSMLTNGKGNDVDVRTQWTGSLYDSSYFFNPYMEPYRKKGRMKFPFFLTPEKNYVGNAWYKRTVVVPKEWDGRKVTLFLERPHIETTVFVNGQEAGHQMSLSVPHCYDVTKYVKWGEQNEIAIQVYNGIENVCVGQDSHSVTDQTQGNWNGIVGRIELQAQPIIWRKRVIPHLQEKEVEVVINEQTYRLALGDDAELWDEFHPHLYTRTVDYQGMKVPVTFGLREIKIEGRQFYVNGRPTFLRGTVENCCFPETGYTPMDEEEWLRVFRKCKEYGLNHVRFHSFCPPEAAFSAADQVGIYLQPEGPSWPNHGVKLRRGQKIDAYLLEESKRIVDTYGHHPSFVMMAAGNEPAGDWVSYCNDWVKQMREYDATKVYCGASVGGGWAWDDGSDYHVKGGARGLDWNNKAPQSQDDHYDGILRPRNYKGEAENQSPIIAHEQGQWCAFPDFKEIEQYTGAYKACNFEIFRDLLRDNGMETMAEKFLMASGKLQTLCYKYDIERNLRTKDYAGFQLLALNDYSGQGTALVGPLNVHWGEKGYVTAKEWREFCSPVVLLARFPKFVYENNETLRVPIECINAGSGEIQERNLVYEIWQDGSQLVSIDSMQVGTTALGKNHKMGTVSLKLDIIKKPAKMTLRAKLGNQTQNHWDFWVYPNVPDNPTNKVYIADSLDAKAQKVLKKGGTVLLTAAGRVTLGSDVVQHYLPVFWNTSWFKMRPPHTTGAYINTEHPLFKYDFPTDDWSNLNWWELLNRAQVMNLMELPKDYQSPIQPIDTWHVSRKLGMVVEARVMKGKLLMTTMDISSNLERRIVARQMRKAILDYMQSSDFMPSLVLDIQTIRNFYTKRAPEVNMFTNDSPDELKPKLQAQEVNYDENKVPAFVVPNVLKCEDGERVETAKQWEKKRRPELLKMISEQEYGVTPLQTDIKVNYELVASNPEAMGGLATQKQVQFTFTGKNGKTHQALLLLYIPNAAEGRAPVIVSYNFHGNQTTTMEDDVLFSPSKELMKGAGSEKWVRGEQKSRWSYELALRRGYAVATMNYHDIYPDSPDLRGYGISPLLPDYKEDSREKSEWGAIGIWAWGYSRIADYLEKEKRIDKSRMVVLGHSRLGKTSLWAGVQDKRFKVVISNESGCGGAALSKRAYGETIARITTSFPHWFCPAFNRYSGNETALPFDQHELLALIAPRHVYVASAEGDQWADPRGEYLSAYYAGTVYGLYGMKGLPSDKQPAVHQPQYFDVGYHIRTGKHDVTEYDWQCYLDFCDNVFKE